MCSYLHATFVVKENKTESKTNMLPAKKRVVWVFRSKNSLPTALNHLQLQQQKPQQLVIRAYSVTKEPEALTPKQKQKQHLSRKARHAKRSLAIEGTVQFYHKQLFVVDNQLKASEWPKELELSNHIVAMYAKVGKCKSDGVFFFFFLKPTNFFFIC